MRQWSSDTTSAKEQRTTSDLQAIGERVADDKIKHIQGRYLNLRIE